MKQDEDHGQINPAQDSTDMPKELEEGKNNLRTMSKNQIRVFEKMGMRIRVTSPEPITKQKEQLKKRELGHSELLRNIDWLEVVLMFIVISVPVSIALTIIYKIEDLGWPEYTIIFILLSFSLYHLVSVLPINEKTKRVTSYFAISPIALLVVIGSLLSIALIIYMPFSDADLSIDLGLILIRSSFIKLIILIFYGYFIFILIKEIIRKIRNR